MYLEDFMYSTHIQEINYIDYRYGGNTFDETGYVINKHGEGYGYGDSSGDGMEGTIIDNDYW